MLASTSCFWLETVICCVSSNIRLLTNSSVACSSADVCGLVVASPEHVAVEGMASTLFDFGRGKRKLLFADRQNRRSSYHKMTIFILSQNRRAQSDSVMLIVTWL